jgi:hypothetical protein
MPDEFTIKEKKWVITRDAQGKIEDISVELSQDEYRDLRKKLHDPNSTFENTSCVNLLCNGLAKARGEAFLESNEKSDKAQSKSKPMLRFLDELDEDIAAPLHALDASINGHFNDPKEKIIQLNTQLDEYVNKLKALEKGLASWKEGEGLDASQVAFIREDYQALLTKLTGSVARFKKQVNKLSPVTSENVELLLSAQDRSDVHSLGNFLAEQSSATCYAAERITGTINNEYFSDLLQKNTITEAFILAQSKIRLRNESLYGAEFVDTYSATSPGEPSDLPEKGLFSIMPYLEDTTPAGLDKMICLISGEPLSQRSLSATRANGFEKIAYGVNRALAFVGLFAAVIPEVVISAAHLTAVIALSPFRMLLTPFLNKEKNGFDDFFKKMSDFHSNISPVKAAKRNWNAQYVRFGDDNKPIQDTTNPHQNLLNEYKADLSRQSMYADVFQAFTPKAISEVILFPVTAAWRALTRKRQPQAPMEALMTVEKSDNTPEGIFTAYEQSYDVMKKYMEQIKNIASEDSRPPENNGRFPGPQALRSNAINSPTRVFADIVYILDEHIINHLANTKPAPATFMFMLSAGTFGTHLLPSAALAGMHGVPQALNSIPMAISHYFMGQTGSMASTQGMIAATMEYKLGTSLFIPIHESMDKNGVLLENIAKGPEEILTALVLFSGAGYAIGYLPTIPPLPINFMGLNQANLYGTFVNFLIEESKTAQNGLLPLTTLEYGALGFKSMKLIDDMTLNGKKSFKPGAFEALIRACREEGILALPSIDERENALKAIFQRPDLDNKLWTPAMQAAFLVCVEDTVKNKTSIAQARESGVGAVDRLLSTTAILEEVKNTHLTRVKPNSYQQLQKAIQMLGDPETPLTFPPEKRPEAIKMYAQLNTIFDTYNDDVNNGKYPGHHPIPKTDFLHAFRNKYCTKGSNNFMRMLSFYPGYPFRFAWRQFRLGHIIPFTPSAFVKDKINASREKDLVLRHQWTAMLRGPAYAFVNLVNKSVKAVVAVVLAPVTLVMGSAYGVYNQAKKALGFPSTNVTLKSWFEALGRGLDVININKLAPSMDRINQALPGLIKLTGRARVAAAAHAASNYDDVIDAGKKVMHRIQSNEESAWAKKNPTATLTHENLATHTEQSSKSKFAMHKFLEEKTAALPKHGTSTTASNTSDLDDTARERDQTRVR